MHISDQVPRTDWLPHELHAIRSELAQGRAERSLQSAAIGSGGLLIDGGTLIIRHPNGFEFLAARRNSLGNMAVTIRRDDGTVALTIEQGVGQPQYLAVKDIHGDIVLSDDALTGDGLARPWIDIPFYRVDSAPPVNSGIGVTQSASFTGIYEAHTHRQHPYLEARLYVTCEAATTGEARLICDGTQIGSTVITPTGGGKVEQQKIRLPAATVGSAFGQQHQLNYEMRRTAGTGSVFGFVAAWWRQS